MASIKKEGSGRWRARVRKLGHKPFSRTFRTRSAAQAWANSTEDKLERGEMLGDMVAADISVCNLLDRYERDVAERKKGYMTSERYLLDRLRAGFEGAGLLTLSPGHVVAYADGRLLTVGSDTVRRELAVLSSAWETAKTLWEFPLGDNPVKLATAMLNSTNTYSRKVERDRRPTANELAALHLVFSEVMNDLVDFAIETAMRRGEIATTGGNQRAPGGLLIADDKTGKTSVIPLSTRADKILDKYPDGFGLEPDSITQAFGRGCDSADPKIVDLRFHDLRHEGTSRFFEKGLSIEEVAKITRHSDWRSLKRYTHPSNELIAKKLG